VNDGTRPGSLADSFDLAAEVGFYFLFSLFPFILFLMAMMRYLPLNADPDGLIAVGRDFLPDSIYALIIPPAVKTSVSPKGSLALPALLACLWTASAAVSSLMSAVSRIKGVRTSASRYWRSKLLSLLFTVVFGVLLSIALFLIFLGPGLHEALSSHLGFALFWRAVLLAARWAMVLFLMLMTVSAVYRFAPGTRPGPRWTSLGAAAAVAGWVLTSKTFALYMAYSDRMNAFYGSLATLLALMSWLYLMALIVLMGAWLDRRLAAPAA
jgi:membrane protein